MCIIDWGGGRVYPDDAIVITFAQSPFLVLSEDTWEVFHQSGPGGAFTVHRAAIVASVGVVLLAADPIVATIQVSRDYVSAAALRADNLSLQRLIWQHVNESCLKLKANINSHLAKGSECPQSQSIKLFDW